MDEYAALAQRVVLTMDDVRGCLVLSRDGMILGAFPEEDEQAFKPAWLTFAHVGEARRGFVEFSDQMWAYVHRGPYAAFVISGIGIRPGILLDQLEQAVLAAEEARAKKGETLKVPDASSAPSGRPRTSLHPPEQRPVLEAEPEPEPVASAAAPQQEPVASAAAPQPEPVASAPPPEQRAWNGRTPNSPPAAESARSEPIPVGGGAEMPSPLHQPELNADRLRPASFDAEVTPAGRPAAFATDGSPFARLEMEQAAAAAERAGGVAPVAPTDASAIAGPEAGAASAGIPGPEAGAAPAGISGPEAGAAPAGIAGLEPLEAPPLTEPHPDPAPPEVGQPADAEPSASFRREPQRLVSSDAAEEADLGGEEPGEVDRVMLAKEFSGLLQLNEDGDEDNS